MRKLILLFLTTASFAQEAGEISGLKGLAVPEPEASPMVEVSPSSSPQGIPQASPSAKPSQKSQKGKRIREKEAEGSEAADRFQADTVIKSRYELNGQSLEVDPD
jgi:hypothetical protein